jgi:tetratricopeptide (TPR) repeat protein
MSLQKLQFPKNNPNNKIYQLYTSKRSRDCLHLIDSLENSSRFGILIKSLIKRETDPVESFKILQACCGEIKHIADNLIFLGKYKAALEVLAQVEKIMVKWEIYQKQGICYENLGDFEKAKEGYASILH